VRGKMKNNCDFEVVTGDGYTYGVSMETFFHTIGVVIPEGFGSSVVPVDYFWKLLKESGYIVYSTGDTPSLPEKSGSDIVVLTTPVNGLVEKVQVHHHYSSVMKFKSEDVCSIAFRDVA
jgi:hypothetical protein